MAVQRWRGVECDVLLKPAFDLDNCSGPKIRLKARRQSRMSRWSQALFPTAMLTSALSRFGSLNADKAYFYSETNTLKIFVQVILCARPRAKFMG